MNKAGKTTTIFLVVISVLLLSLTAISIFFFKKENELRKLAESKLAQAKALEVKLDQDLKEAKKQVFLFEEKNKEADDKINGLMDELELQKGVRDQMKSENDSLKEALTKETKDKEALNKELAALQEKAASLEENFKSEEKLRVDLESKVKDMEQQTSQQPGVELEKIVVTPGEIPQGKIIDVNMDNNFVIFNLGQEYGIKQDMLMSIFRKDNYLGDVKVSRVQEGMSVADFIPPLTSKQVKKDDRIVLKK